MAEKITPHPPTVKHFSDLSVVLASLLALSGGFLDVYTFIGHGGVFVNTMTGNIVFMGIYISQGQWMPVLLIFPSIAGFLLGTFVACIMHLPTVKQNFPNPALICLRLEIVVLLLMAILPSSFPDSLLIFFIATAVSMQSYCFNRLGKREFSSVVTTGNLRIFAEAVFKLKLPYHRRKALHEAKMFGLVCLCFLVGTIIAASFTTKANNYILLIPVVELCLALLICKKKKLDGQDMFSSP